MTDNPYRPGVGLPPAFLAGRDADQTRFRRILLQAPSIPGNIRMTGLRGVGKTVLMKRFQELAEEDNWATISLELEARHCDDAQFRSLIDGQITALENRLSRAARIRDAVSGAIEAVRRAVRVTYNGFEWSLSGDLDIRTTEIVEALVRGIEAARREEHNGLLIFLDEAQVLIDEKSPSGSHPLSSLIAAVSTLQKQGVPISLILCGLPTLAVNLLGARTYTERMFQGFNIDSLDPEAARQAFVVPLQATGVIASDDLVEQVMAAVDGYPYFIQLWGAELWDAADTAGISEFTTELLSTIDDQIYSRLDLDFYAPRVESLRPAEQDLLLATAGCNYPPLVVGEMNKASRKTPGNVNVLLGRLVKANVLYRPRKGEYRYTAPGFRDYLLRRKRAESPDDYPWIDDPWAGVDLEAMDQQWGDVPDV